MTFFSASDWGLLVSSTMTHATPLILAGMGGIMSETSGVVNIGLEGMMTIGAFAAAAVAATFFNPWMALLAAVAVGGLFGLLHVLACVTFKADQTISGIAVNLLAPGFALFLCKFFFDGGTQTTPVDLDSKLPMVLGNLFGGGDENSLLGQIQRFFSFALNNYISAYFCLIVALIVWFVIFKSRMGLRIRAVGEHPKAAATLGINVARVRYFSVISSGMLAGLGGGVIVLSTVSLYEPAVISGKGFIAIAAVIFGKYRPRGTVLACLLFGFTKSLATLLSNPKFELNVSTSLMNMVPYIATLVVLLFIGRSYAPAASGKIYDSKTA